MAKDETIRGLNRLIRKLSKLRNDDLPKEITKVLDANADEIVLNAKLAAPVHDGILQNSIHKEKIDQDKFTLERRVVADAPHAPYVEFGTKSKVNVPAELQKLAQQIQTQGSTQSYEQGLKAITDWVQKNGIEDDPKEVFKRILIFGVHPRPFLYPAFVVQRKRLLQDLQNMLNREMGKI